jgi:phosphate transport system substrate-binding protein
MIIRIKLVLIGLILLTSTCTPQPLTVTYEPTSVRLIAADSCGPLAMELAAAYEADHPWAVVQVEVFNTSVAEQSLRAGEADLALLSWMQETTYKEPLWKQVFAHDGIAVISHPDLPFDETGLAHLQNIFRGQIQEWGGTVIVSVSREDGSGTRRVFDETVLGIHKVSHTAVVMSSGRAVIEYVARTPGAIGYVSVLQLAESDAASLDVMPVEGLLPVRETIIDNNYPLSRPIYLASVSEPTGEAREFAQWLLEPEAQAIVEKTRRW